MTENHGTDFQKISETKRNPPAENLFFQRSAIVFGACASGIGVLGLADFAFDISTLGSIFPGYQTMAFSTAVLCILFGTILIIHAIRPFRGKARVFIQLVVAAIAVIEALEFPLSIHGNHFIVENLMVSIGNALAGPPTPAISPGTLVLVILSSIGFFILLGTSDRSKLQYRDQDAVSITGLTVALVSFTILLSYAYRAPFLYGTNLIPLAAPTALALTFIGAGLAAAAGPESFPLRYFIGQTIRARLLRTILPLTFVIIFAESIISHQISGLTGTSETVLISTSIVIFSMLAGYMVFRASQGLGGALEDEEQKRKAAEDELVREGEKLAAMNEKLTATGEELRSNLDDLAQKERELRESEERYRLVAEYNYDWEFWVDNEGNFIYNSPSCERVTGYSALEFSQDPRLMSKIVIADDRDTYESHIADTLTRSVDTLQLDFRIVRKNGEIRWINHFCQPIYGRTGSHLGRRGSNRDITERKRAEDALAMANKKLNILNRITRHDIVNQLTAIQGFLELYHEECQGDAKLERYFTRLIGIAKTIENQIMFTKFYQELGVQAPVWQRVQNVANIAAQTGGFGDIRFTIETGTLEIFADPLLEKVFFNMYENSTRHGGHVTEIRVSVSFPGGDCIIVVEDNGIGVPVAEKERIFERGVGKHTGLGLFLAREILAITGITIRETGEPGKGARFEITVPNGEYRSER